MKINTKICDIVEKYNQFQKDFGLGTHTFLQADIDELCTPNFIKTINGEIVGRTTDLLVQLTRARDVVGTWAIEVTYIIPAADEKYCFFRYKLISSLRGTFDVIALVTIVDDKIDCIDEMAIVMGSHS